MKRIELITLGVMLAGGMALAQTPAVKYFQEEFPFQTACVGTSITTNLVKRVRNGNPVLDRDGQQIMDKQVSSSEVTFKGVTIRLDSKTTVLFDTDLLRMSAGWTGGYITSHGVVFDGAHGQHPDMIGDQHFSSRPIPGWAKANGSFADGRLEPYGPVSPSQARWDGLYVAGTNIVLSYTVLGTKIYEHPSVSTVDDQPVFLFTFDVERAKDNLVYRVCDAAGATRNAGGTSVQFGSGNRTTGAMLIGAPHGMTLSIDAETVLLKIPKGLKPGVFTVALWNKSSSQPFSAAKLAKQKPAMIDFKKGGPAHWKEPVVTQGVLASSGTPDGAYVLDQLTPPVKNPWNRRVRFSGIDFFPDGKRAALSTWDGDVWIVSGINDKLDHLEWRRFASGGYETLGIKIVDGVIYTSGRDQITRYHDLNGDGEADYYENFNNSVYSSMGFHEFVFDLKTDSHGNFFMAKAGPVRAGGPGFGGGGGNGQIHGHSGSILEVSKDGKDLQVYASGFRAPNGISIGPDDQITSSDNEGTWVPATPINWIKRGGFYGVEQTAHNVATNKFQQPLAWLAHSDIDNSGGGEVWVNSDRWGAFDGDLLHMSYGKASLFLVMKEKIGDQMQGGVVRIPVKFTSSAMRATINPKDGQLYVAGLQGWQTSAANITGLDRIRYTGKPVYSVHEIHVHPKKVELVFTQPLDKASATDLQNWDVKRWNYHRTEVYGSPEFSLTNPAKQGRDTVEVQSAELSADGKHVTLQIPDLMPVMQELINFDIKAKDGTPIKQSIQHTINVIP